MADEVIFEDGKVSVSRATLRVKGKTYSISGIGSVEARREPRGPQIGLLIVLLIATPIVLTVAGPFAIIPAVLALGAIGMIFSDRHQLMIRTASGELQAMEGKKAEVNRVKEAVEKAFTMRG